MRKFLKSFLLAGLVLSLLFSFGYAKTKKSYKVAWLGVYTQSLDDDLVDAFKLPVDYGAIINEVVNNSPADKAGLEEDDIIISFNGKKVRTSDDLVDFIDKHNPGDTVKITVVTEDGQKDLAIKLGRRKTSDLRNFYFSGDDYDDINKYYYFNGDTYPFIGVSLSELSDQLGEYFGVRRGEGVLITNVEEDSPAEKAGLKAGDVIVAVDGEDVENASDVQKIIRDKEIGDTAQIRYFRDKKEQTVKVEVEESESMSKYGNIWKLHVPDLPAIDILTPKMKGLYQSLDKYNEDKGEYIYQYRSASKEYKDEMKKLKEELKKMQKELKDIHEKLD